MTNDRLLGTPACYLNMWTWKLGTGHGYTYRAAQWWFGLQDPPDEWGVAAYHWYDDPALSPDGSRLAMTDAVGHPDRLCLAATHGPAWSASRPTTTISSTAAPRFARPTLECSGDFGVVINPSWAPDSNTLAFGGKDGVHVMYIPDGFDCKRATDALLAPGGTEPAFGRADVNMAQRPDARLRISHVRLSLRGRRPASLRFNASAPVRVRVTISGIHGRLRLRAHAGRNAWSLRAPALRPGRHVLRVRGGGTVARLRFRVYLSHRRLGRGPLQHIGLGGLRPAGEEAAVLRPRPQHQHDAEQQAADPDHDRHLDAEERLGVVEVRLARSRARP